MSIYKAQCMVLPVPSPVVSTCCLNLESVDFFFPSPRTNMINKYVHHLMVQDRNCRKSWSVLSRDFWITKPISTIFSIQFIGFHTHWEFDQTHSTGWRVEMARGLWMNPAKRAPNMPEHHHHVLVHVDTVGVDQKWYQRGIPPISWDGLWSVNRSNRLWPRDWKRVFRR